MRKLALAALLIVPLALSAELSPSKFYRAFLWQWKHDPNTPLIIKEAVGHSEDWVRQINFMELSKSAQHMDLNTAVSVEIQKTGDCCETVVRITDVDGAVSSLWVKDGKVATVTPY